MTHFKSSLQERKNSITGVHKPPMQVILKGKKNKQIQLFKKERGSFHRMQGDNVTMGYKE